MPPTTDDGYRVALGWLSRRALTRAEVRARLQKYGVSDVESVLDRLVAHQWLSDQAVAEAEFRGARRRHHGPERLRARLYARGVDPEVARDVMQALSAAEVHERAREALLGVISKQGIPRDEKARARVVRRLLRQGFSSAVIARTLQDLREVTTGDEGDSEW